MTILFDEAIRQLLEDYASLQAEHQRLSASVPDSLSYEAHTLKLYRLVCRVQFVLDNLQQALTADAPSVGQGTRVAAAARYR